MRRTLLILAVSFSAVLGALPKTAESSNLDFTMINSTDQPIVKIWTSPTTDSTWYLSTGVYVAANGGSQKQTFANSASGDDCYYDLRLQFQGGSINTISHIDLCNTSTITISVDASGHVVYDSTTNN